MNDFNLKITGDKELTERFAALPENLHKALVVKVTALAMKLQAKVVNDKLSGQVLNRVTGKLARSIFNEIEDTPEKVVGKVASSGDVKYARRLEMGFHGTEDVKEHIRHSVLGKAYTVRAFTRQANTPERPFLRSALADMKEEILAELHAAATQAIRKDK